MSDREQFNVRIDGSVADRFRSFAREHRDGRPGALGRETENALREYMDNDRAARIEANLNILLEEIQEVKTLLDQEGSVHTQTSTDSDRTPETIRKLNRITGRIQDEFDSGAVVKEEFLERSIKHVAGANPQTIRRYKSELKAEGYAYEHPGRRQVWFLDKELFFREIDYRDDWQEIIEQYPLEVKDEFLDWDNPEEEEEEGGENK